jgi:uncharacterized protein YjiS (DUF1127 family)
MLSPFSPLASPEQDNMLMTMLNHISHSAAAVPIIRKFAAHIGYWINHWLAAWMARQERLAARSTLLGFNDRQLRDIGLVRSHIDGASDDTVKRD